MHMGVFLGINTNEISLLGFPHAHGGVSVKVGVLFIDLEFSPCTWGCF